MSQRNSSNILFPIVITIVILVFIGLVKLIIDTINNTRNQLCTPNVNTKNQICAPRNQIQTYVQSQNYVFEAKSEDEKIYTTALLSNDDEMVTFTININDARKLTGIEFSIDNQIVKTVKKFQETDDGYIVNGMWIIKKDIYYIPVDNSTSTSSINIPALIRNGKLKISLKFEENKSVSGFLLGSNKVGRLN